MKVVDAARNWPGQRVRLKQLVGQALEPLTGIWIDAVIPTRSVDFALDPTRFFQLRQMLTYRRCRQPNFGAQISSDTTVFTEQHTQNLDPRRMAQSLGESCEFNFTGGLGARHFVKIRNDLQRVKINRDCLN